MSRPIRISHARCVPGFGLRSAMVRNTLAAISVCILGLNARVIPINDGARKRYESTLHKAHKLFKKECHEGTEEQKKKCRTQEKARELHAFDQRISDRLPLERAIPDSRPVVCGQKDYEVKSTVSVIIPFYHEATSTLLRTAKSVIARTPEDLLAEVIIVSDGADSPWAKSQKAKIKEFTEKYPKAKFLEMEKHLGLAPAKAAGAKQAKGEIVAFLDSHCEVNVGWYEPLAASIEEDRGTIANPIIDGISLDDFSYHMTNSFTRGVFTWGMYFAGEPFSNEDQKRLQAGGNVDTPAMPGGLFAVDRAYFEKLGFYDEGLRVWGGENIELSLKAWRCGGRVIFVPCSRVGHVYKAVNHRFPRGESLHKNYKRIAEVWLDEYRDIYFKSFPIANAVKTGDLSPLIARREKLECKSMSWFIENVYPTLFVPKPLIAEGMLQSGKGKCVDSDRAEIASNPMQDPHVAPAALLPCHDYSDHNQWWFVETSARLIHIGIWTEECLGVRKKKVVLCQCARYPGSGCNENEIGWKQSSDGLGLVHKSTGLCLTHGSGDQLQAAACNGKKDQAWTFTQRGSAKLRTGEL